MHFERLVIEAGDNTFTLDLHPRLTVIAGVGRLEREGLVSELVGALSSSRPGVHLELEEDSGRHLAVFRPHGARHRVVDVEQGLDISSHFATADGSIDLLARAGLEPRTAKRYLRMNASDLTTSSQSDQLIRDLAAVDQAEDGVRRSDRTLAERRDTLVRTPAEVDEGVFEPYRWAVEDWRRTCTWTATVTWEGGGASGRFVHDAVRFVEDSRQDAHPEAGVAADPLVWPASDDVMREYAGADLLRATNADLSGTVTAFYAAMWRRGADRLPTAPAEAADDLLAALRLTPDLADRYGQEALAARYGLTDLSWAVARR